MNTCDQVVISNYSVIFEEYKERAKDGILTSGQIDTVKVLIEDYYSYLQNNGIAYGEAATDVSQDTGFFGSYANELLREHIEEINTDWNADEVEFLRDTMMIEIAFADTNLRQNTTDCEISYSEIADYHWDIFEGNGLPKTAWGGTAFEIFGGSGSWMGFYGDSTESLRSSFVEVFQSIVIGETKDGINAREAAYDLLEIEAIGEGMLGEAEQTAAEFFGNLADYITDFSDESTAPDPATIDNSLLDIWTDTGDGATDQNGLDINDNGWLDGLVMDYGNGSVYMMSTVLNGDGFFNVSPSYIVSDGIRPGAFEISEFNLYDETSDGWFELDDILGDYDSLLDIPSYADYYCGLNNFQTDSLTTLNIDPLVIDLDGDGVELLDFGQSVALFDVDNDGYVEDTGWVSPDDGLLAHDLNGDGIINNITELLSQDYAGGSYSDGFTALATLDSNSDGVFDASDTAFAELSIWQDADGDGITDEGELQTLTEAGITSINLSPTLGDGTIEAGNEVLASGTTTMSDGSTAETLAVDFITNPTGHQFSDDIAGTFVNSEAGLSSYVVTDENGAVVNAADKGVSSIYGGTGDDTLNGDENDNWLAGGAGSDVLSGGAGNDFLMVDSADGQDNIDGGEGFDIVQVVGDEGVMLNLADANVEMAVGGRGNDILMAGGNSNAFIQGGNGDDVIIGGVADDALSGENGDDLIDGSFGDDLIRGHRGEDTLIGGAGEDIMDGGLDDDILNGGTDDDILIGGGGNDTLDGGDGHDIAGFQGSYGDYTVARTDDGYLITDNVVGRDGTSTLKNIEGVNFSDIKDVELATQTVLPVDDIIDIDGEQNSYTLTAAEIVGNDLDFQGDTLSIAAVQNVEGGSAVLNEDGTVTFTPYDDFTGVMSFKYNVVDENGNGGATVSVEGTDQSAEMVGTVYLREPNHPTDPLFYDQWYLTDANVLPVWEDYTGKGVEIGQFELGIADMNHTDLSPNISEDFMESYEESESSSMHATLVAGVMLAEQNTVGSVGIAHDAELSGFGVGEDGDNLNIMHEYKEYDIVNNSWAVVEPFADNFLINESNHEPFTNSAEYGRNGLGTNIVFGAGNDRQEGGSANTSNFTNNRHTTVVGAINKDADLGSLEISQTPFSNAGANILVSAAGSNITSTSQLLENDNGSTFGGDYDTAQGTSFATPIVSAVIALMLEANSELGYRDVQQILAYSARSVDDSSTSWQTNGAGNWNGGGLHTSHDYGFGNVDATAAVRLAETWTEQSTYSNEGITAVSGNLTNFAIADNGTISDTVSVGDAMEVEHVEVTLHVNHENLGDLVVQLTSPDGTESVLLDRLEKAPDTTDAEDKGYGAFDQAFTYSSTNHWGENSVGDWTLTVTDEAGNDVGTLVSWELQLFGAADSADDTYIYTNEFSDVVDSARVVLTDADGTDAINAAAVTSDSNINLNAGSTSTIDGQTLTIDSGTTIENAFSGDGDDTITGNNADNLLYGGRGDDALSGGAGEDILLGAKGNDTITGGTETDRFIIHMNADDADIITDFETANADETITLVGFDSISSFDDLVFNQVENDVQLDLGYGQTLTIQNALVDDMSASQFRFDDEYNLREATSPIISQWVGTDEDDSYVWNSTSDQVFFAEDGDDTVFANTGDDEMHGGNGNDTLVGEHSSSDSGGGDDLIYGDAGNDQVYGGSGNDELFGGEGIDVLYGNAGDDILHVKGDVSAYLGGEGADSFVIHASEDGGLTISSGLTTNDIYDLDITNDTLDFTNITSIESWDDVSISSTNWTINGASYAMITFSNQYDVTQWQPLRNIDPNDVANITALFYDNIDPEAQSDGFVVNEDTPLTIQTADLLANDTDLEDGTPQFDQLLSQPSNGSLTDNGDGTFTYTANADFYGEDQFTYQVVDSLGQTSSATAVIRVDAVNDAPEVENSLTDVTYEDDAGTIYYDLPEDTFTDAESDLLSHTVTLADGTPLPDWMTYQESQNRIQFDVSYLQRGSYELKVKADDGEHITETSFNMEITTVTPTDEADTITGTEDGDIIYALQGDDIIYGLDGNDWLEGGDGNDTIDGGDGYNFMYGQAGDDTFTGGGGKIDGGDGIDTLDLSAETTGVAIVLSDATGYVSIYDSEDTTGSVIDGISMEGVENLTTGSGSDYVVGNSANNIITGGAGVDNLRGLDGDDTIYGGADNDYLLGNDGIDIVYGGSGEDNIFGGIDNDTLYGDSERDFIFGEDGDDIIYGGDGDDYINGDDVGSETGNDTIYGEAGADNLRGSYGSDTIYGGDDGDYIQGQDGDDILFGDAGMDNIYGGDGNDTLEGGADTDFLIGGSGIDYFVFNADDGTDHIMDFEHGVDVIQTNDATLTSFDDIAITQSGSNVNIQMGTTLVVAHEAIFTDFTADDFMFV